MPAPILVALVVAALCLSASGLLLSRPQSVRLCGIFLALTGAASGAAVLAFLSTHDMLGARLLVFAGLLLLPSAVLCYPYVVVGDPVELLCAVVVLGVGLLGTISGDRALVATAGFVSSLALITFVWWRLEHAGTDRAALTWLAVSGICAGLLAGTAVFAVSSTLTWSLVVLAVGLVGPCLWIGVVRPHLVDARALAVQLTLALVVGATYLAAFASVLALVELAGRPAPTATALGLLGLVLAAGVPPLAHLLRDGIDELLFGRRRDPLTAATDVVGELRADDPTVALTAIQNSLVVPYVALTVEDRPVAAVGSPPERVSVIPLPRLEAPLTELLIGLRPGEQRLGTADRRALALIVPLLELTVRQSRLAADLQRARQDSVADLEDERRRLRRDLHDGLGPRLSGIAYTADAARNLVRSDPDSADQLLRELRRETGDTLDEIRRIAYAMRPPALDELGLVAAVQQQTRGLRTTADEPLAVTITAHSIDKDLPAAVEVTAYRLIVEAVNNAAKHSGSDRAEITLSSDGRDLTIAVTDHGTSDEPWIPGVGIVAMKERAAALGGSLTIARTGHGGLVRATLPLSEPNDHDT